MGVWDVGAPWQETHADGWVVSQCGQLDHVFGDGMGDGIRDGKVVVSMYWAVSSSGHMGSSGGLLGKSTGQEIGGEIGVVWWALYA